MIVRIFMFWLSLAPFLGKGQVITFSKAIDFGGGSDGGGSESVITIDSGYVLFGLGYDLTLNGGWSSCMFIKTDIEGNVIDKKFYGKWGRHHYIGMQGSFILLQGGTYAVAVTKTDSIKPDPDAVLIKFDENGDTVFIKLFDFGKQELGHKLIETKDNGFLIAGTQSELNAIDPYMGNFLLIKADSSGNLEWHKTYSQPVNGNGLSIVHAHDGGYIMSGWGQRVGYDIDTYIIKTDSAGNEEWKRAYGTVNYDGGGMINYSSDSSYIINGHIDTFNLQTTSGQKIYPCYIMKIDLQGNIVWRHITNYNWYHQIDMVYEVAFGGGYIAVGQIYDEMVNGARPFGLVIRIDVDGNVLWEKRYAYPREDRPLGLGFSTLKDVKSTIDGGFIIIGNTNPFTSDFWFLKIDSNGCMGNYCGLTDTNCYYMPYPYCEDTLSVENLIADVEVNIYPNPTTQTITIEITNKKHQLQTITLYDITGKAKTLPFSKEELERDNKTTLDLNHLPQGIYFCNITLTNGQTHTRKIIKQ